MEPPFRRGGEGVNKRKKLEAIAEKVNLFPLNLYMVRDNLYDFVCFVIEKTPGKAKAWCASNWGADFIDMRCNLLKKGVDAEKPLLIECETDKGYDIVQDCGYRYTGFEEDDWWTK